MKANTPILDSLQNQFHLATIAKKPANTVFDICFQLGYYHIYFRTKTAKNYLDSLKNILRSADNEANRGKLLVNQAFYEVNYLNDLAMALKTALRARELLKEPSQYKALAMANIRISSIVSWSSYQTTNNRYKNLGIESSKKIIEIGKQNKDLDIECIGYIYLANQYNIEKKGDLAKLNLELAEKLVHRPETGYFAKNLFYGTQGVYYSYSGKFKEALEYWEQSLALAKKQNDLYSLSSINRLKADYFYLYALKLDYEKALNYSFEAYRYAKELGSLNLISNSERDLYLIYRYRGDTNKALEFFEKYWLTEKATSKENVNTMYANYEILANETKLIKLEKEKFEKEIETKKQELNFLKLVQKKDAEIAKKNRDQVLAQLQLKKKESQLNSVENDKLKEERKNQDLIRNILVTSLLAGLCFILFFYNNNQKLQTKNQQLAIKNQEIEEALLKGTLQERKRVASELNDNLSAKISGIRIRMEAITPSFSSQKEESIYQSSVNAMAEVYTDVRLISHNLLPAELETKGLEYALTNLVNELNSLDKTKFTLTIQQNLPKIKSKIEYELFSIILELTHNIMKHSAATNAEINLQSVNNQLILIVSDNGIGLSDNSSTKGIGLTNLVSRVESMKGNLNIENDNGVKVKINVPV